MNVNFFAILNVKSDLFFQFPMYSLTCTLSNLNEKKTNLQWMRLRTKWGTYWKGIDYWHWWKPTSSRQQLAYSSQTKRTNQWWHWSYPVFVVFQGPCEPFPVARSDPVTLLSSSWTLWAILKVNIRNSFKYFEA